jgi:avidin family protein
MLVMARPALLALMAFVLAAAAAMAQDIRPGSSWKGRRGSVLTIATIDARGSFQGTFENKAPGFGCHDKFDASGTITKTHIVFVVTFKNATANCNMMTVWRGTVSGTRMSVRWDQAHTNTKTGRLRFYRGVDVFNRM